MGILGRDEIGARLESGDFDRQIFRPGSWDRGSVRGAAYDLRVAPDYLILPSGERFWPQAPDPVDRAWFAAFDLEPGDVAFVSSAERLSMPWDLVGNVSPKFRLALDGLWVMGGMMVDPGYGRVRDGGEGCSTHEDGERLHFQLVNLGVRTLRIVPTETKVATIQFVQIEGDTRRALPGGPELDLESLQIPNPSTLLRDLFHPHATEKLPQLAFFSKTTGFQDRIESRIVSAERNIANNESRLEASDHSHERVIVFGFYLLLITLLAAFLVALINSLAN